MGLVALLSPALSRSNGSMGNTHKNPFPSSHSFLNRSLRLVWQCVSLVLFRCSPRPFHGWRRFLLRLFGGEIGDGVHVYPTARVWAPWLLRMGDHSCLGPDVDCYNVGTISVGRYSTVSQYSYLCGATHDYARQSMPLQPKRIVIEDYCWIAADVFVGPEATIREGVVVGARSSIYRDVGPWAVVAGNPARVLKPRTMIKDVEG